MAVNFNQSDISDVRDQLSLDFASGEYLNVISSNLGINRPTFGFNDDQWRALVKIIALDYKQVVTQFYEVLSVMFGPQTTQVGSLSSNAFSGSRAIHLNNVSQFPQVGSIVLDEGLSTQENLEYSLVDYKNNVMFLTTPLVHDHMERSFDVESPILLIDSLHTKIVLTDTNKFPESDYPYPVVLGSGTEAEEVVLVTNNDPISATLDVLTAPQNDHTPITSTVIQSSLTQAYHNSSVYIVLEDTKQWPNTGVFLTDAVDSFTASGGSLTSVEVPSATFTEKGQVGNIVVFAGNTTPSLEGVEAEILSNDTTTLTFWGQLPTAPASGDDFSIRVRKEFTRNDYDNNVLLFKTPINDVSLPTDTVVELLSSDETAAFSPVKVSGVGWDVIQSTPKLVELLIPEELQSESTLRASSYIHTNEQTPQPSTTTTSSINATEEDIEIDVNDTTAFPTIGVVTLDSGGSGEENVVYVVIDSTTMRLPHGLDNSHAGGVSVELYQPAYSSTDLLIGDNNQEEDTFSGPYLYSPSRAAPTASQAQTVLNSILPGSSRISISQNSNRTAVEVDNAIYMVGLSFPSGIVIGKGTGNREELNINDLFLKRQTTGTISSAISSGDTEIETNDDFPDANGYRVLVNDEVFYVVDHVAGTPNRLILEDEAQQNHNSGDNISILSDVLVVDPLASFHAGSISRDKRSTANDSTARHPKVESFDIEAAEPVNPQIGELELVDDTGFSDGSSRLILNFGFSDAHPKTELSSSVLQGDTIIPCANTSSFFSEAVIVIDRGKTIEEIVVGTNDTTVAEFDISTRGFQLNFAHDAGAPVETFLGTEEVLNYSSKTGTTVSFSPPIVLDSGYVSVPIVSSTEGSEPQDDGFGYPLSLPTDIGVQLNFVFDLIRAAGVQVEVISER